jgi:hypothetical protein
MRCRKWIEIPVEMIAKQGVEWLGDVSCEDYEHPMVRVELKCPTSSESRVLAELLSVDYEQTHGIQTVSRIQPLRAKFVDYWFRYCFDCISNPAHPKFGTYGCCDVRINTTLDWPWIEYRNCQTSRAQAMRRLPELNLG